MTFETELLDFTASRQFNRRDSSWLASVIEWIHRKKKDPNEAYPDGWLHCVIHLNPETGEMHSDGDHRVREWIETGKIAR